ncbi:hypothetical protein GYMLUDRAFT_157760 [Collybiopsis luxurians FD-317 M1]|nr:hypothetical protein GYMLUDRAFT_157760 [Collybiopsis luxurians FD-317 M1]
MPAISASNTVTLPSVTDFALQAPTTSPEDPDPGNSCNDINNCRTGLQIIWSCIAVLVACTWASIHPNIPGPKESWWKALTRKIGLMMLCLLAPELLIMWAARQWVDAWLLSNRYRHQGWTMTHATFALMGGFALYEGDKLVSVLRFVPVEIRNTPEGRRIQHQLCNEIKDRSRVDWFGKLIAIGQTSWFIAQLIARWAQGLAVTELEIMTVAFATLSFMMYYFWWNKPLEVGCHIRIQANGDSWRYTPPLSSPGLQTKAPQEMPTPLLIKFALHLPSFKELKLWPDEILGKDVQLTGPKQAFLILITPIALPLLLFARIVETSEGPPDRILSFEYDPSNLAAEHGKLFGVPSVISYLAATLFGAIHCIAWNFTFPTGLDQFLWRMSSFAVTFVPFCGAICNYIGERWKKDFSRASSLRVTWQIIVTLVFIGYITARLTLIVETFLAFRNLPQSALRDVAWTSFIPHI